MTAQPEAARLIAVMYEAQGWSTPDDCADHPILGPAIEIRRRRYQELKGGGFTKARIDADTAAIEYILKVVLHD